MSANWPIDSMHNTATEQIQIKKEHLGFGKWGDTQQMQWEITQGTTEKWNCIAFC